MQILQIYNHIKLDIILECKIKKILDGVFLFYLNCNQYVENTCAMFTIEEKHFLFIFPKNFC